MSTPATELTQEVLECTPDGKLNRDAVGWSRRPLHHCNLSGNVFRKKRWDYWCVTSRDAVFSVTYTNLDYVGLADAWFMDFATRTVTQRSMAVPLGIGFWHPETVNGGDMHFDFLGLALDILVHPGGTQLRVRFDDGKALDADLFIEWPPGHETLNVLVPWSDSTFQFTSKHNTRPVTGTVKLGERAFAFGPENDAFGCLDFGRGIWPYETTWNWGSVSGVQDGRAVGLNLGGRWTDGTGARENALCLDGRLHRFDEDLVWTYDRQNWMAPWRIRAPSGRVDLTFTPFFEKQNAANLGVLATELHVQFGRYEGTVVTDGGESVPLRNLVGWAEEHHARW